MLTLVPKQESSQTQSLNLLDFILKYRGENAFRGFDEAKIDATLRFHIFEDTILTVKNKEGGYIGVLLWTYETWIPMRVNVEQLVAVGCSGRLLTEMFNRFPPNVRIFATRTKDGIQRVEYKNHKRFLRFMLKIDTKEVRTI